MKFRATFALALVAVVALAAPAAAHVTVSSPDASPGGFGKLVFRVPNESDTASTTDLEVAFPDDAELQFVSAKPVPGWTVELQRDGDTVTGVTWTGGAIAPGEFQEFEISAGPLPEADELSFPTVQTYDDGEVARWVEPTPEGGAEPEHPAPVLSLTGAASTGGHGAPEQETETAAAASEVTQDDVDSARLVGIAGVVVGAIGIGLAVAALTRSRRT